MHPLFIQIAAYHFWANQRLVSFMVPLERELWYRKAPSSFDSLYKTLHHLWQTELVWARRLQVLPVIEETISSQDDPVETGRQLLDTNKRWTSWINHLDDASLSSVITYCNSRGEQFQQPVYEILFHLFNHATYHRGQLITLLHQLGVSQLPATDFIIFTRESNPQ